jgi:hypothetical protein
VGVEVAIERQVTTPNPPTAISVAEMSKKMLLVT